jgi:hypothetical protein
VPGTEAEFGKAFAFVANAFHFGAVRVPAWPSGAGVQRQEKFVLAEITRASLTKNFVYKFLAIIFLLITEDLWRFTPDYEKIPDSLAAHFFNHLLLSKTGCNR